MSTKDQQTVTRLLGELRAGDGEAARSLLDVAYSELRGLALAVFSGERRDHTLQPTALVHEAWLKLAGDLGKVEDRTHFFAIAARAMRRVLTDHARMRRRQKRSGEKKRIVFEEPLTPSHDEGLDLVDLADSLERLAALNDRHARIVELRFFGGLTIPETAEALGLGTATVEREWFVVRGWLRRELHRP